jgi:IS605 OrfB family transposase
MEYLTLIRKIELRFLNENGKKLDIKSEEHYDNINKFKKMSEDIGIISNNIISKQFALAVMQKDMDNLISEEARVKAIEKNNIRNKKDLDKINQLELILNNGFTEEVQKVKIKKEIDSINKKISSKNYLESIINSEKQILIKQTFENYFGQSLQNITYQDISKTYLSKYSSFILAHLNSTIVSYFNNEIKEVLSGKRSLRRYGKFQPISSQKGAFNLELNNDNFYLNFKKSKNEEFKLLLNFGKDSSNNKIIIDRIYNNLDNYEMCDGSSISVEKGKLFFNICYKQPKIKKQLDYNLSVGVDLGINIPAYCSLSIGEERLSIGSRENFLHIRTVTQGRRRNLQRNLQYNIGGHGSKKKLKKLEIFKDRERNFVNTYNHMISSRIIKFALNHGAGVIKLEHLKGISKENKYRFILRNWSYYELQQMIIYKAKKFYIDVMYVDPYLTSQTCHACGKVGNRKTQSEFFCENATCTEHNKKQNADYNASKNIANSTPIDDESKLIYLMKNRIIKDFKNGMDFIEISKNFNNI